MLIEVLLTLLILTVAMGTMVGLQVRSYNRLMQDRQSLEKLCLLKRSFLEAIAFIDPKHLQLVKKEYELYDFKTKTEFYEISKQSALAPFAKNMRMIMTDAAWFVLPGNKQYAKLVSFVCIPGVKESKVS